MKKVLILTFLFWISLNSVHAQKGLFARFSLGPGYTIENSVINSSGLAIATKNHAIGWGLTDQFAVFIGEFGSLNKISTGEYDYINLDAFGLGVNYQTPKNIKFTCSGAYGMVSLAHSWKEAMGDDGGKGFGVNISLSREWLIAKRWGLMLGPHVYFIQTMNTDYRFMNLSLNFAVNFYLTPVK